ncbi:putative ribosome-binding factor A, mitochondrial [Discoglossus pictus]
MALLQSLPRGGCVCRAAAHRDWFWRGCTRLLASRVPQLSSAHHASPLHLSAQMTAKNLLRKLASKSKKKFWYDSPSLGNQFINQPPSLVSLMKTQRKERREDNIRIRALNVILYKALTDLLSTSEVSQEVYDLNVELSKVSVTVDFSVCRAYWMTSGCTDTDSKIENILQKYAPRFRHLMLTQQVLGSVPPVVFVRDKEDAIKQEVEKLLSIADFGPDYDRSVQREDEIREFDSSEKHATSSLTPTSLFGIDHLDLNRQIGDYKKKMKDKVMEAEGVGLSQQHHEQLAELRKQKILKKKLKQKGAVRDDSDVSPQKYLQSRYSELDIQEEATGEKDLESELQEAIEELEEEDDGRRTTYVRET